MVRANVLEPLPLQGPFDSAALTHVIHCLPGPLTAKAPAIKNIASVLTLDGVLFGEPSSDSRQDTLGQRARSFASPTFRADSTTAMTTLMVSGRCSRNTSVMWR